MGDKVERPTLKPLIVARCGDLQDAPENTMPAFESAIAKGADTIEFDVHLTKDSELVVHHDYYLGRTNDGSGRIGSYTLEELKALDVGSWFDAKFAGEKMPTLGEVLALGRGKVRFEIDMRTPTPSFFNRLVDEIVRFEVVDDVELTSSHIPLLFQAKRVDSELRVGVFFGPLPDWMGAVLGQQHIVGWMRLTEAQVAHLPSSLVNQPFVRRLHRSGFLVHGSSLDTEEEIENAVTSGCDQFSTGRVKLAIDVREKMMG